MTYEILESQEYILWLIHDMDPEGGKEINPEELRKRIIKEYKKWFEGKKKYDADVIKKFAMHYWDQELAYLKQNEWIHYLDNDGNIVTQNNIKFVGIKLTEKGSKPELRRECRDVRFKILTDWDKKKAREKWVKLWGNTKKVFNWIFKGPYTQWFIGVLVVLVGYLLNSIMP